MDFLALLVATGLVSGATYGLIAMGFALIYKSTGVVYLARGRIRSRQRVDASFSLANTLGLPLFPPLGGDDFDLHGDRACARTARPPLMLGEPVFSIAMATVGLAVILRGIVVLDLGFFACRTFRTDCRPASSPLPACRFYPAQLCLLGALALVTLCAWLFLRFTRARHGDASGRRQRDGCIADGHQCRSHSRRRLDDIAAVAGVLFAINFKLAPDMWFQGLKSFPAVNPGGLDFGHRRLARRVDHRRHRYPAQGYLGQGLREIAGFVALIVVLMVRPYGLFGSADIERVLMFYAHRQLQKKASVISSR